MFNTETVQLVSGTLISKNHHIYITDSSDFMQIHGTSNHDFKQKLVGKKQLP
jgi:hypothetical protein